MKEFAEVLQAVASLLWPLFAFCFVYFFRGEIRSIVKRIKRGKFLGQEVELDESIEKLGNFALVAASEVSTLPSTVEAPALPPKVEASSSPKQTETVSVIEKVLELAQFEPKVALMTVNEMIEKELKRYLLLAGPGIVERQLTGIQSVNAGIKKLPDTLKTAIKQFLLVKHQIVHGGSVSNDDILRAVDSGITIIKTIQALPFTAHVVYHPGFEKGRPVTPQWSARQSWGQSYYIDPSSGEIKEAWTESLEYIGSHFNDLEETLFRPQL